MRTRSWIRGRLTDGATHRVARYGVAIASVVLALLVSLWLNAAGVRGPLFIPAILLSAWFGGIGPGLLAAGLSILATDYFFLRPMHSLGPVAVEDASYLVVFGLTALLVAWLTATQRRAATEMRRQASLLDLTHDTVFVRDPDDVITYWNRGAAQLYGWSSEEAIGKVAHQLLQTIFTVPLADIEATLYRTDRWEGELVHTRRDGTRVAVASRWSLQRDRDGRPTGVLETNNDITARKDAEEELRRQKTLLEDAQRLSHTGSFRRSLPTGEAVWSEETYRIYELDPATAPTPEMLIGRIHPEDVALVRNTTQQLSRGAKAYDHHYRLMMPDGRIKFVHAIARAQSDGSGGTEFVGAIMDVTELRRSEEQWRQAQAELAHVTRVTMLGELTASIAHEVNQPLAALVMNGNACLRWLASDPPNLDEARQAAQRIVSDGNRASQVIARVRTLLKRQPAERSPLDVNELIVETLTFTRSDIARHDVSTRTELRDDLPAVTGDRVQLQQVLVNLILNAADAMSEVRARERLLTIRSRNEGDGNVLFEVEDCGKGLAAGESDRIFDAFFSTKSGGLGMGLSVSRSIVEMHGGRIAAVPNNGPGVTLQVSLPAAPVAS